MHAKIGELMREKKIEGISEVRDESDRDGMRLVIELKKDVVPAGRPQPALPADRSADDVRRHQPRHRRRPPGGAQPEGDARASSSSTAATSSRRRTRFELRQAEAQREIVEGLGMAITEIDLVDQDHPRVARHRDGARRAHGAAAARASRRSCAAPAGPKRRSPRRRRSARLLPLASARPRRSSRCASRGSPASSRRSSPPSTASSATTIARLRAILADEHAAHRRHRDGARGDPARSTATSAAPRSSPPRREINDEDLIQEEDMVVTISHAGYIKRTRRLDVPRAEARRQGQDRHGGARRGLGHPALRRLDARATSSSSATRARST